MTDSDATVPDAQGQFDDPLQQSDSPELRQPDEFEVHDSNPIDLTEVFGHNPNAGVDPVASAQALDEVVPEPGSSKPDPILVVDKVSRAFGGLKAVDVDHLEIQRGVITALIGPNGAGKTTFFNLLTNFDTPDTGHRTFRPLTATPIWADGDSAGQQSGGDGAEPLRYDISQEEHALDGVSSYKVAELGMVRTFQLTKALSKMTCIDNMMLGATHQRGESVLRALLPFMWKAQEQQIMSAADGLLDRFRMSHMRNQFAGTLSGGQRKLLEMARALMVQPKLVMLDEPMAGVNPALTQSLLGHITGLRDSGMSVVFVEHDMDMVQSIADWVVVMAEGRIIAEGRPAAIAENQAVVDAYLGSSHDSALDLDKEL